MKKNYLFSAIALCVCLLTACNKEIDTPQTESSEENKEGVITYIRATGNENASKGSIDGTSGNFSWNVGDQIAVWNTIGKSAGYNVSAALTSEDFSGDNATFSFTDLGERSNYAVSPAWIRVAGNPTWVNLPGTYDLTDIEDAKSPVPMIAVNNEGTLHFKQLGALLRITLNNLPPSTRSVTINFNGKKVQGTFAVSYPSSDTPSIATEDASAGNDVITINTGNLGGWTDGKDVNIPVPTGTYTTITVKSWTDANGGGTNTLTMTMPIKPGLSTTWKPIRTSARKMTASLPAFSVSSSTRVAFAPGNLVATISAVGGEPVAPTAVTWSFHANQYDHCIPYQLEDGKIKSASTDISSYYDGTGDSFDLFGYGTSGWDEKPTVTWPCPYPWNTLGVFTDYGPNADLTGTYANCDWGVFNIIKKDEKSNYPAGYWRTPTGGISGEWNYLLQTRGTSLRALGIVNEVPGLIILPDYFVDPATNESSESALFETGNYYFNNTDANPLAFEHNVYNGSNWTAMEKYGAIFLPAVGWKGGNAATQSYLMESDKDKFYLIAQYWSSTIHPDNSNQAYQLRFGRKIGIEATSAGGRNRGLSVRLVHDLN